MDTTHSPTNLALIGLLMLATLALLLLGTLPVPTWDPAPHADQRHGTDAEIARQTVQESNGFCRWSCPDGRDRFVCPASAGTWAVVVMEAGREITAFLTGSQEYVNAITEPCKNNWRYSHP